MIGEGRRPRAEVSARRPLFDPGGYKEIGARGLDIGQQSLDVMIEIRGLLRSILRELRDEPRDPGDP